MPKQHNEERCAVKASADVRGYKFLMQICDKTQATVSHHDIQSSTVEFAGMSLSYPTKKACVLTYL